MNTLIYLKANGRNEHTLEETSYRLTRLGETCDLANPEEAKTANANLTTANADKQNYVNRYASLCRANKIEWKRPYFKAERRIPTIPTKEKIMEVITASKKYAPIFKVLMETGLMPFELSQVQARDVNFETRTLTAQGFKGHLSRTFKLSQETAAMLSEYFLTYKTFPTSYYMGKMWIKTRNKVAAKLQDAALKNVRLYDLRHYYATMLYAKTNNIMLVKQQLGHRKIETTLIYTQRVNQEQEDEYTCAPAKTIQEATKLIEDGYQYITDIDGIKLFKKWK